MAVLTFKVSAYGLENCTINATDVTTSTTPNCVITAKDGFFFDDRTVITLKPDSGLTKTYTLATTPENFDLDNKVFTQRWSTALSSTAVKNVTVTGGAYTPAPPKTIIQHFLTRCSSNFEEGGEITQNDTLILKANKGYFFDDMKATIKLKVYKGGTSKQYDYDAYTNPELFSDGARTFTLPFSQVWDATTRIVVTAQGDVDPNPPEEATWSETVHNATSNIKTTTVLKSDTLIVTANQDYEFTKDRAITLTYNDGTISKDYSFDPVANPTYFTVNNTVFTIPLSEKWDKTKAINLLANTSQVIPPRDPMTYMDKLTHVTSNLTNNVKYDPSTTVVLTAEEGHSFQTEITVVNLRRSHPTKRRTFYPTDPLDAKYFNDDKTVFTHRLDDIFIPNPNDPMDYWDVLNATYTATAKEIFTGQDDDVIDGMTTPFANVYQASDSVLSAIVNDRWLVTGTEFIDMGEYIYKVYKYPFALDPILVSQDTIKIKLGRHETKTLSKYFLRTRVKFDLGKITVDEEYKNVYDYRDVTCLLHVPYSDPIPIDSTYVIGQEVQLYYMLDLYTGTTTLEVYSTKIANELVMRQDIQVAYDIPFMMARYNDVKGRTGKYLSNRVKTAYIEVVRPVPYDTMSEQGKEGKEVKMLSDFKGYVEIRDVHLNSNASDVEQARIIQLLNNGVYIN